MKQSTVNVIVIAGVIVMAAGAWTMPLYQAGLSIAALDALNQDLSQTQTDITNLQADISGDGLTGKQDLVSLMGAAADETKLKQQMGKDFSTFQGQFFKQQTDASQFNTIEVKAFTPANPRQKLPNNLNGFTVTEAAEDVAGNLATPVCNTVGTQFDADPVAGGVQPLSANQPSSIDGWALMTPAAATDIRKIQLQICIDGANQPTIVDELIQLGGDHTFTKNFNYGVIPPNTNLRVVIHDSGIDADGSQQNYGLWIFRNNPIVEDIRVINDVGGGLAGLGAQCTSITVNVKDGVGADLNGANVKLSHSFLPLFKTKFSAGAGQAVFNAADFGGTMPPGLYFVDVFPPPDAAQAFPFFKDQNCPDAGNATPVVTATLATAAQFAGAIQGAQTAGLLTVKVTDQFNAPIQLYRAFVDAAFAPIATDVCQDGIAGASAGTCVDITQDSVPVGTLADAAAADGTFTLNNLPLPGPTGDYFIDACAPGFFCAFQNVNLQAGTAKTVTLKIFLPVAP